MAARAIIRADYCCAQISKYVTTVCEQEVLPFRSSSSSKNHDQDCDLFLVLWVWPLLDDVDLVCSFTVKNAANGIGAEERRCATAEEHCLDSPAVVAGRFGVDVPLQRLEVGRLGQRTAQTVAVEIAIGALLHAPGQVYISRERGVRPRQRVEAAAETGRAPVPGD